MDVGLVCDGCSTFNPMGAQLCSRCDAPLSLDPAPQPDAGDRRCPACSADVAPNHKFCGECGHRMSEPPPEPTNPKIADSKAKKPAGGRKNRTMFFGAMQASRAKLTLIKGDGLDGVSFTLAGEDHLAGRGDVPLLFEEDPFLSPEHANFLYRKGQLIVRDENSANGVYIRIRNSCRMQLGDRFLIGEQVLEVADALVPPSMFEPGDDGTYFYASPHRESSVRIVQLLRGGDTGLSYRAPSDVVSLGREGNDVNFPDDPFISGHHAQVLREEGAFTLTDLGSKNGTFLRVNGEAPLEHGDYVFMGQQLLRVEIV